MTIYTCDHANRIAASPARMTVCHCGGNVVCPVCGFGWGQYPCGCSKPTLAARLSGWHVGIIGLSNNDGAAGGAVVGRRLRRADP